MEATMQTAQKDDYVTVEYEGMLKSGEIFESSDDNGPLSFVIGQNGVFPSFEKAVVGMAPGETKTALVGCDEAYGPRREELVQTINRSALDEKIDPQVGMVIGIDIERDGQSQNVPAMIIEINEELITIDYNHPLAGQDLQYKITLESIAEPEEPADTATN
jgi:peptidylprolyl isomerase